jgi:Spy/CpxP family protein refolding chaperone
MTRLTTSFKALALGLAVITGASFAFAAPDSTDQPAKPSGAYAHHKGCNVMGKLGLSDEQRQKLKAQHEAFRQENAQLISDMKAKFQQLRNLPKTEENKAQRAQLRKELRQARKELHSKHMAMMQQVLTPEQFQRYTTLKQQCRAEWRKKREAKSKQG